MNQRGFAGLIGLLVIVAIVCCMAFFMSKQYFGKPTGLNKDTQEMAVQAGMDTTSQAGLLGSAKSLIKGAEATERSQGQ